MFVTKQQKRERKRNQVHLIVTVFFFLAAWAVILVGGNRLEQEYAEKLTRQEEELQAQSAEESVLQEQVEALAQSVTSVQAQSVQGYEQVKSAAEQRQAYEDELNQYEEENNQILGQCQQLQQENASLSQQINDLQAQLPQQDDTQTQIDSKMVYITFDDGPSDLTLSYLDVLDQYGIKATFFVTYQPEYESVYREIVNRGHAIGIHSTTHDYNYVYASYENWLADFSQVYNYVIQVTGVAPQVYRFPGGSNGSHAPDAIVQQAVAYLNTLGIQYFDWNVSNGDGNTVTAEQSYANVMGTICNRTMPVVLMHDGVNKETTLQSLPSIFQQLIDWGYHFGTLNASVLPIHQDECWDY